MKREDAALAAWLALVFGLSMWALVQGENWVLWLLIGTAFGLGISVVCDWITGLRKTKPAPQGASEGETTMFRGIGNASAGVSIPASYIALATFFVVYAITGVAQQIDMPVFGGKLYGFVHDLMPFIYVVWIVSNMISALWAGDNMRKHDVLSSKIAFWGMAAIAVWVGISGGYRSLVREDAVWFVVVIGFAFFDWWFAKGENSRLSEMVKKITALTADNDRLQRELAAARAQLAALPASIVPKPVSAIGPYVDFVRLLGVTELNPTRIPIAAPDTAYLVLLPDGTVDLDVDMSEARVREILAAALAAKATRGP